METLLTPEQKHLKELQSCLERMFRFCQRHNVIRPRIKIGYLSIEISKHITDATPDQMRGYDEQYAEHRSAIRRSLLDADDLHKNNDDTTCLMEDVLFLLNSLEDKLAFVTANMAAMRRDGFDDFNSTIALAVALTGRNNLMKSGLARDYRHIKAGAKSEDLKKLVEKYKPLVEKMASLDSILDGYIKMSAVEIVIPETGGQDIPEPTSRMPFQEVLDHCKAFATENVAACDESLLALNTGKHKWRKRKYNGHDCYYLTLTKHWRLRLLCTDIPWAFECDITDSKYLPILSPNVTFPDNTEPDIDTAKHETISAAIKLLETFRNEYKKQLDWIQKQSQS